MTLYPSLLVAVAAIGMTGSAAASSWTVPIEPPFPRTAPAPFQDLFDQSHPRQLAEFNLGLGTGTSEITEIGNPLRGSGTGIGVALRYEVFNRSQLGAFVTYEQSTVADAFDDSPGAPDDSSADSTFIFIGGSFRATISDKWRVPIRMGPYLHVLDADFDTGIDTTEYQSLGLRVAVEPEYIFWQSLDGDRMSELAGYFDFGVGAGFSDVESATASETGYAFRMDAGCGVRYRLSNGLFYGGGLQYRKVNFGATDSNDDLQFFGIDDDFLGVALKIGWRG